MNAVSSFSENIDSFPRPRFSPLPRHLEVVSFRLSDAPGPTLSSGWRALPGCSHLEVSRVQWRHKAMLKNHSKPFILISWLHYSTPIPTLPAEVQKPPVFLQKLKPASAKVRTVVQPHGISRHLSVLGLSYSHFQGHLSLQIPRPFGYL